MSPGLSPYRRFLGQEPREPGGPVPDADPCSIGTFIRFDSGNIIGFLSQSSSPPMTLRFEHKNILIMMIFCQFRKAKLSKIFTFPLLS